MPLVLAVFVFVQYAGRIGHHRTHLLGGDEEFQDILPVIFGNIHIFQRYCQHPAGHDLIVIEAVG